MRSFIVLFVLAVFLILLLPVHLVTRLLFRKNPEKFYRIWQKLIYLAFSVELFNAGCRMTVIGRENIPDEACLYVSNHQSYFDILTAHNAINRPIGFVAKTELLRIPLLPIYMRDIGCIFLNRTDPREGVKTIKDGAALLASGHNMHICPEGTRSRCDEMNEFKEGSLKIAEKAKARIVPVAIIGTNRLLECRPGFSIRKGDVTILIGEPFALSEIPPEYKRKSAAYTQTVIQRMITEYQNQA